MQFYVQQLNTEKNARFSHIFTLYKINAVDRYVIYRRLG